MQIPEENCSSKERVSAAAAAFAVRILGRRAAGRSTWHSYDKPFKTIKIRF
jgi:hypothetical protein